MIKLLLYSNLLTLLVIVFQYHRNKYIHNKTDKYIYYKLPLLTDKDYQKINGISNILWINLDRSIERKMKLLEILDKVQVENTRIKAIDGKKENVFNYIIDDNNLIDFNTKKLSNGEIACCLSHIKAISYIKYIIENSNEININSDYVLILEDDIKVDYLSIIKKDIKQIIKECPYNFDILMLYSTTNLNLTEDYTNIKDKPVGGACSYIIKKDRINKLLDIMYYDFDLNKFIINRKIKLQHADYLIFHCFNTYVYKYNFFSTCDNESTLHQKYLKDFKKSNHRNKKMIIKDLIYNDK